MSKLAIIGALATILSTLVTAAIAVYATRLQAKARLDAATQAARNQDNASIEIGHKVLIDGIEWSQTQMAAVRRDVAELQAARDILEEQLKEARDNCAEERAARLRAERRSDAYYVDKQDLEAEVARLRERLNKDKQKEPPK